MVRSFPVFVEGFEDIDQYSSSSPTRATPEDKFPETVHRRSLVDSAPVRRCGPASLGDDDLLIRVGALNRIEVLTGVRHCLRYRFVFPHRVGMNGNDIQFFSESGELI